MAMRYSLMVTAAPDEPAALTALYTARAILDRGHGLYRIFFYRDGVHLATPGADGAGEAWQAFVRDNGLDATACSGAAGRRGLFSDSGDQPAPGIALAGLGEWVDAMAASDRILCFGA